MWKFLYIDMVANGRAAATNILSSNALVWCMFVNLLVVESQKIVTANNICVINSQHCTYLLVILFCCSCYCVYLEGIFKYTSNDIDKHEHIFIILISVFPCRLLLFPSRISHELRMNKCWVMWKNDCRHNALCTIGNSSFSRLYCILRGK